MFEARANHGITANLRRCRKKCVFSALEQVVGGYTDGDRSRSTASTAPLWTRHTVSIINKCPDYAKDLIRRMNVTRRYH